MFDADEQPEYEFKEKVIKGYEHCHRFCQSIPQDLLEEKGPMYAQFGRMKMFYKCAMVCNLHTSTHSILQNFPNYFMFFLENGKRNVCQERIA